jgi:hypothetical protein
MDDSVFYQKIEGKYRFQENSYKYSLNIKGPNTSKRNYGEYFSLITEETFENGGGIQEILTGKYSIQSTENILNLIPTERHQESWLSDEEAEGEAFVEPYKEGPIIAIFDASTQIMSIQDKRFRNVLKFAKN